MLKFIHLKVGEKMIHESLKKDFSEIADMEGMEQFRNKTFLITGSTGLIGSLLIKFFILEIIVEPPLIVPWIFLLF